MIHTFQRNCLYKAQMDLFRVNYKVLSKRENQKPYRTRNPFLMFQTFIHDFCFWGFIRVPKVFLSEIRKLAELSWIRPTFSFSASLRWNLMIASSEQKLRRFPKFASLDFTYEWRRRPLVACFDFAKEKNLWGDCDILRIIMIISEHHTKVVLGLCCLKRCKWSPHRTGLDWQGSLRKERMTSSY